MFGGGGGGGLLFLFAVMADSISHSLSHSRSVVVRVITSKHWVWCVVASQVESVIAGLPWAVWWLGGKCDNMVGGKCDNVVGGKCESS